MKLSQVVNLLAMVLEIKKIKIILAGVPDVVPYRSPHRSSDCDETSISCCKYSRGGFGNLKNLKIVLAGVPVLHFPYRGIHRSSDRDETFTSYWKHTRDGVGNLIYI